MAIRKIKKQSISEEVLEEFKRLLASGEWAPGDKLPAENELAAQMGVSRVTIRGALQKLSSVGLIESRQGGGTFVCEADGRQYMHALIPTMLLETQNQEYVLEFRRLLECEQAYLAALRRTEEDLEALRDNVMQMRAVTDPENQMPELDLHFHLLLARAAKNPLMLQTSEILQDVILSNMRYEKWRDDQDICLGHHEGLLRAVEQQDADTARRLMEKHMSDIQVRIDGGIVHR